MAKGTNESLGLAVCCPYKTNTPSLLPQDYSWRQLCFVPCAFGEGAKPWWDEAVLNRLPKGFVQEHGATDNILCNVSVRCFTSNMFVRDVCPIDKSSGSAMHSNARAYTSTRAHTRAPPAPLPPVVPGSLQYFPVTSKDLTGPKYYLLPHTHTQSGVRVNKDKCKAIMGSEKIVFAVSLKGSRLNCFTRLALLL